MSLAEQLEKLDDYRWRIPRHSQRGMRTDVVVYATKAIIDKIAQDKSLEQAANVASLPGIVGPSLAMPDIHQGYGFPIGGVCATDYSHGVVSPGGVGFDINCGVRLVRANLQQADVRPRMRELLNQVFRDVPCGTGGSGFVKINFKDLDGILLEGARWMVNHGYGESRDAEFCRGRRRVCLMPISAKCLIAPRKGDGHRLERWAAGTISSKSNTSSAFTTRPPRERSAYPRTRSWCSFIPVRGDLAIRCALTICGRWARE